jgi:undecaprenyl-diphosphatase
MTARPFFRAGWIALYFLVGFAALAAAVSGPPLGLDERIAAWVQSFETPSLTRTMMFFSLIGDTRQVVAIAAAVMLLLFFALRRRMELLFFSATVAGSSIWNNAIKLLIRRERPDVHRLLEETGYSFPSGHTMVACAMYGALVVLLWRHAPSRAGRALLVAACAALILAIALSRIYLGVHYPSDIVGGLLAGGAWLALSVAAYRKYLDIRRGKAGSA